MTIVWKKEAVRIEAALQHTIDVFQMNKIGRLEQTHSSFVQSKVLRPFLVNFGKFRITEV